MRWVAIGLLLCLANCASITEGTSQNIAINTDPPGATCRLDRAGQQLGTVDTTPGTVTVKPKTSDDILVTCEKPGYSQATFLNKSDTAASTFGNIVAGGAIGILVDRSSGAAFKYDGVVTIALSPSPPPPLLPAAPGPVKGAPQS